MIYLPVSMCTGRAVLGVYAPVGRVSIQRRSQGGASGLQPPPIGLKTLNKKEQNNFY